MFMLVPGMEVTALYFAISAVWEFLVASIWPNASFLGISAQQWSTMYLVMAF